MAYSAVTQPWPLPFRKGGTVSSTLAVQITRVFPVAIRQLPQAVRTKSVSIVTGRFSSGLLPSARVPVPVIDHFLLLKRVLAPSCGILMCFEYFFERG
jgi:hypothetical protein